MSSSHKAARQSAWLAVLMVSAVGCTPKVRTEGASASTVVTEASLSVNDIAHSSDTLRTINAASGTAYTSVTVDLGSDFTAESVCSTKTIFGRAGTASCPYVTGLLFASGAHRNVATTAIAQTAESRGYAGQDLPSGYREVPDITRDDDGGWTSAAGCTGLGGVGNTCTTAVPVSRATTEWGTGSGVPRVVCGKAASTLDSKIADCDTRHAAKPSWDASGSDGRVTWSGTSRGIGGEGSWTLVTIFSGTLSDGTTCDATCYEVWRDDRTGLLWSDNLGTFNWCQASGSSNRAGSPYAQADLAGFCDNITYQDQVAPISVCAEDPAWLDTSSAYDAQKGNLRRTTTPAVRWRLPTKADWQTADNNGVRLVLPNRAGPEWSATLRSFQRSTAFLFSTTSGVIDFAARSDNTSSVRCVGR